MYTVAQGRRDGVASIHVAVVVFRSREGKS
jgi:hypothetical protein